MDRPSILREFEGSGRFTRLYGMRVDVLFQFYQFPAEHWSHIRTTNPIESLFVTVRHRTRQTKGCGSTQAPLAMVFQLVRVAEKKWSDSMAVGRSRRFCWVSNLLTA